MMSQNQMIALVVVVAVVAGGVGFWFGSMNTRPGSANPSETTNNAGEEARETPGSLSSGLTLAGKNAIAIDDQDAGSTATVRMATLAEEGWVVIHEDWKGAPGNILGARRLTAGEHQAVVVDLLRSTENGKVYYAMLHRDDGDKAFAHTRDLPLTDAQGSAIMMRFVATSKPGAE